MLVWLVLSVGNRSFVRASSELTLTFFQLLYRLWGGWKLVLGNSHLCRRVRGIFPELSFILFVFLTVYFSFSFFSYGMLLPPSHRCISPLSLAFSFLLFSACVSVLKRHLCASSFCRTFHLQLQTSSLESELLFHKQPASQLCCCS